MLVSVIIFYFLIEIQIGCLSDIHFVGIGVCVPVCMPVCVLVLVCEKIVQNLICTSVKNQTPNVKCIYTAGNCSVAQPLKTCAS